MMGRRKSEQGQLFYAFDLDAVVPDDHQVRRIAAVLWSSPFEVVRTDVWF